LSLSEITNFAEITAALATIATLVYLAIQIRDNTVVQKAEARRAIQSITSDYSTLIVQDKEVAKLFTTGLMDVGSLDINERMQFFFLLAMLVGLLDQTFADYQLKIIDEELFLTGSFSVFRMLKTSGGREFWAVNSGSYTSAFRDYVDSSVYEGSPP
jgi:hypothetical protein